MVTDRQTDGQTDRQNDKPSTVTLAAHARRGLGFDFLTMFTNIFEKICKIVKKLKPREMKKH